MEVRVKVSLDEKKIFHLFLNSGTVFFVTCCVAGNVFVNADFIVSGGALLFRHILVNLIALLLSDSFTDIVVLGFIVCLENCFAFLFIGSVALVLVDGLIDLRAIGTICNQGISCS